VDDDAELCGPLSEFLEGEGLHVVFQERPPCLRRRVPTAYHVFADAGLAHIDAEFEQFAVDAGRPERILAARLTNQLPNLFRHRWAPGLAMTDFPRPELPEALAVPANDVSGLTMTRQIANRSKLRTTTSIEIGQLTSV
jgi:hypothetical protein